MNNTLPELNSTACTSAFTLAPWDIATGSLLSLIDVVVFVGNLMVIVAALTFEKLKKRGVTNVFISSLAVSDLLLSLAVLPLSIVNQVMHKQWIFGPRLCRAWLVVDVLCCTASILNLVLIASDRFFAIKHPIRYPKLMTLGRARCLVALSWLLAFGISFPPMLQLMPDMSGSGNCTHYMECSINQSSIAYIIYSASGSFFLPAAVMMYFYLEIYRAVRRTIQNVRRGEMVLKSRKSSASSITSDCPDTCVMRVHLGGSAAAIASASSAAIASASSAAIASTSTAAIATASSAAIASSSSAAIATAAAATPTACTLRRRSSSDVVRSRTTDCLGGAAISSGRAFLTPDYAPASHRPSIANSSACENPHHHHQHLHLHLHQHPQLHQSHIRRPSTSILPGLRKRASGDLRLKSIYNETKAARMLAVIGISFTVCWLPFFSVYVLGGFCDRCVPEPLFDVFFWMGYCNSAINPYVYALLSRDFREAFHLLLCRFGRARPRGRGPAATEGATAGRQSIRILINDDLDCRVAHRPAR